MLADQKVVSGRPAPRKKEHGFRTQVSRSCCIVGDSNQDIDALKVDAKLSPDTSLHIAKEPTQARTQLSFVLPFRLPARCAEIRLQYRFDLAQGPWGGVQSVLAADRGGKNTPLTKAAPTHTSTWLGQITVSEQWALIADRVDTGHDALLWALEFEAASVSGDLIDVGIFAGEGWVVFKGSELLRRDASVHAESALPAGDDLAGLIRVFETQYEAWGQMRQALADEIDYLRRRLDEAHVKPANRR